MSTNGSYDLKKYFPENPVNNEQYVLWDKTFTFYDNFSAWLPEEFIEPISTSENRDYTQYVLNFPIYVLLNKNLYFENTR